MNTGIDDYRNEFFGEIVSYILDKDYIWFYDEISGGLFRLDKKHYIVEVVLSPMEIHQRKAFPVRQILKWENEIYLISNSSSHEWLIYNIESKKLRSVLLPLQSYKIGNAVSIGNWIYLIPEKTDHVLAIIEAGTLSVKTIITDWYKDDISQLECWGYSVFNDIICFPIIGMRKIFLVQGEQIVELSLYIKQSVYSVSLSEHRIWVLPSEGDEIFCVDKNGEQIDSVKIQTNCDNNTAKQFVRIIAIDSYVYLFPRQGGQIFALEKKSKEWTVIGKKEESLYRSLYQKTRDIPYWCCYDDEGKLYTLPLQYRFAEINVENKTIKYIILKYGITFDKHQYTLWVNWLNKKTKSNFVEWEMSSLENLLKDSLENNVICNKNIFGKDIWMVLNKL